MKKTYTIEGMHCKACELLLKKSCEDLKDCAIDSANHRTGKVVVDRKNNHVDEDAFNAIIENCGYSCVIAGKKSPGIAKQNISPTDRVILLLVALVIAFVLIRVDVLSFITTMQMDASLGMIILLGLIASVSSCLAVTGGVIIGFTEMIDKSKGRLAHAKLQGSFQGGRIVGFFVFGALLGILGQTVSISLGFTSGLNAIIALVFIYLGLQIIGILPALSSFGFQLPEKWTTKILGKHQLYFAPVVGALTFFLPCGFTQGVQLMALASGSRWMGGLMMMTFALGTLPGLLALGMGTSFAKNQRKKGFEVVIAVILLIFGFFTFRGSARMRGWTDRLAIASTPTIQQTGDAPSPTPDGEKTGVQKISLGHNGYQVVPETTVLEAGKSYELTIIPESNGLGCMSTVTLPRIDNSVHRVIQGQAITYTIENAKAGQYSFVCGAMGMQQGKLIIN